MTPPTDTPTPETDANLYAHSSGGMLAQGRMLKETCPWVLADFARKLERQRDEANKNLSDERQHHMKTVIERDQERSKLHEIGEYLWPNQTGLPNEHRDALLAITTRERLLNEQLVEARRERDEKAKINTHFRLSDMATSPKGGSPSRQRLEDYDELRSQLSAANARVEELTRERDEARQTAHEFASAPIFVRCLKHIRIKQQNANEATGSECGGCIAEERDALTAENAELKKTNERAQELLLAADADIASRSRLQIATDKELESLTVENARLREDKGNLENLLELAKSAANGNAEDKVRLDWLETHHLTEVGGSAHVRYPNLERLSDSFVQSFPTLRSAIDAALQPKPETKEGE